jgi:TPP-dependent pyruvate/acetoin dehydrogenase alpha subunit
VDAEIKQCIERAEAAPAPSIASMFEEVFEHMPDHLVEQQRECVQGPRAKKHH